MNNIVIAHFNENIEWIKSLSNHHNILIYSKTITTNQERHIPINRAQEVPMYLKYITDFYTDLPSKTLFLHAHSDSYHQDFNSKFICENVKWDADSFFSVNKRDWYQEVSKNYQLSKNSFDVWLTNYWYKFEDYLPFPKDGLFFYSGAQFVVAKDLILQYPKSFYEKLYQWVLTDTLEIPPYTSNEIISRIFEYTWHYIFTKNPVEKIKTNNDIFYK